MDYSSLGKRSVYASGLIAALCAVPAQAQTPASSANGPWTVELHVGAATSGTGSGKEGAAFPIGQTLVTTATGPTSRAVSSWLFGDGAVILNAVNTAHNDSELVVPLDSTLRSMGAGRSGGAVFGIRVNRALASRWSLEFAVDDAPAAVEFSDDAREAFSQAASSFGQAWEALMAFTPSASNITITATSALSKGSGGEVRATAALRYLVLSSDRVTVSLLGGLGTAITHGSLPSASLSAGYGFTFANQFPINELDQTTVRVTQQGRASLLTVFGGGMDFALGPNRGLRADARVALTSNQLNIVVDTDPFVRISTPAFAISTFTSPSLQWSNNPAATGRTSTLSGAPLQNFETFIGEGSASRFSLTIGYFWRF